MNGLLYDAAQMTWPIDYLHSGQRAWASHMEMAFLNQDGDQIMLEMSRNEGIRRCRIGHIRLKDGAGLC